jgi:hypothetical protein
MGRKERRKMQRGVQMMQETWGIAEMKDQLMKMRMNLSVVVMKVRYCIG